MSKPGKPAAGPKLAPRRGVLDWEQFHFLENLALHCAVRRSVPAESGVQFYVSAEGFRANGACILFHVDRTEGGTLFPEGVRRPDYLAAFVRGGTLWLTVIEMKGRTENGLEGAIEQIQNLITRLRQELARCASTKLKVRYQGLLLSPPNSQVPVFRLNKLFPSLPIAALQSPQKFNLGPYVVGANPRETRYDRKAAEAERNDAAELLPLEDFFLNRALPERRKDAFCRERVPADKDRACCHTNFAGGADADAYVALFTEPGKPKALIVSPRSQEEPCVVEWLDEAKRLGVEGAFKFQQTAVDG